MSASIGSYILIKSEAAWIGGHLANWLPYLDAMVFFDGGSKDGTLEIIKDFIKYHPHGKKIILREGMDPKDLQDDYVRLFNACLRTLETDYAFFLHPDMVSRAPEKIRNVSDAVAYWARMESFAGEPDGPLYRIRGRDEAWAVVHRLHRPDLGLVYHGHYGAWNESLYPTEIVGDSRDFYGSDFHLYPYRIEPLGLALEHYSDVRPYARRLGRMISCLKNQGQAKTDEQARAIAEKHPRVTLKDGGGFTFEPAEPHPILANWKETLVVRA